MNGVETAYIAGDSLPWVPFTPLAEEVMVKYWKIDPVRGETVVSMRFPPALQLRPHVHTGAVIAHTIKGCWRYLECDALFRRGDTVYVPAGVAHTPESCGEEEAEVFFISTGELLFFDDSGEELLWTENWKTAIERYDACCRDSGLPTLDLTSFSG
jgi:2,4'-dihydroxyacetophenone dioxygenase